MIRRPLWFGAGLAAGVAGTVWAERRVRRQFRRAVDVISPSKAGQEAMRTAREASARLQTALDAGRNERRRREAELWRKLDETSRGPSARPVAGQPPGSMAPFAAAAPLARRRAGSPTQAFSTRFSSTRLSSRRSSSPRLRRRHR